MKTSCDCDETYRRVDGHKEKYNAPRFNRYHDCAYVRAREKLIPIAEAHADFICGARKGGAGRDNDDDPWGNHWTKCFAAEMERLYRDTR